jgi:hypothetical protein
MQNFVGLQPSSFTRKNQNVIEKLACLLNSMKIEPPVFKIATILFQIILFSINLKVKFVLEQAMRTQRGRRCIAVLFL